MATYLLGCFLSILLFCSVKGEEEVKSLILSSCDSKSDWIPSSLDQNYGIDTQVKKEGTGSIVWGKHDTISSVSLNFTKLNQYYNPQSKRLDCSNFTFARFWIQSNANITLMLKFGAESPETDKIDYFARFINVVAGDWNQLSLPLSTFSAVRSPLWSNISDVTFYAGNWGTLIPDPNAVVHIDYFEVVDIRASLMNDATFFNNLDLSLPSLATIKSKVDQKDYPAARIALATYMRGKNNVVWDFDYLNPNLSQISYSKSEVENTIQGRIVVVGKTWTFPDGNIDWTFNPTINSTEWPFDPEWQWQSNRMSFWGNLGLAWLKTKNATFSSTFVKQLTSFVQTRPCPLSGTRDQGDGSSWRTIEAGIRTSGSWPAAFLRFLKAPEFTDDAIILMVKSFMEHGIYLRANPTQGNWLTMEMNGLFSIGTVFPEFKDAREWRQFASAKVGGDAKTQFLPDGGQFELSTMYHQIALDNIIDIFGVAQRNNYTGDIPADFVDVLLGGFEWNVKLMTPTGGLPVVNDAVNSNVPQQSAKGMQYFPESKLLAWAGSPKRVAENEPTFTSLYFPDSGFAVMRTGWENNAQYGFLDVGPAGHAHVHQDKLNFILYPYGRELLYDNGGGNYEESKWRTFGTNTFSHNTIIVDGLTQQRRVTNTDNMGRGNPATPPPLWKTTEEYDYARGTYMDGYGNTTNMVATHHRELAMVKSMSKVFFVVVDTLIPNDQNSHSYEALWNLKTTNISSSASLQLLETTTPALANLAVVSLTSDVDISVHVGEEDGDKVLGWNIIRTAPFRTPTTELVHKISGSGVRRLVTFFLPLNISQSHNVTEVSVLRDNLSSVHFGEISIEIELPSNVNSTGFIIREKKGDQVITTVDTTGIIPSTDSNPQPTSLEPTDDSGELSSISRLRTSSLFTCLTLFFVLFR